MKIQLAKSAGFCFGVRRALDIAFETAKSKACVQMLGDIVHNEDVMKEIEKKGIQKIKKLKNGKNKYLLIRAHGASLNTFKEARRKGYWVVDATCPMVKEIHRIAQEMERQNRRLIIIGDKHHDEVQGIVGQLRTKAIVIDALKHVPETRLRKIPRAAVIVQSTQNTDKVERIVKKIRQLVDDVKFFNTICGPTRVKQAEIKSMPRANDVVIVIGSKASANTRRLYEISKRLNKKTYWVRSEHDISPGWFKGAHKVGVTAGASTPRATTQAIIKHLKKIS